MILGSCDLASSMRWICFHTLLWSLYPLGSQLLSRLKTQQKFKVVCNWWDVLRISQGRAQEETSRNNTMLLAVNSELSICCVLHLTSSSLWAPWALGELLGISLNQWMRGIYCTLMQSTITWSRSYLFWATHFSRKMQLWDTGGIAFINANPKKENNGFLKASSPFTCSVQCKPLHSIPDFTLKGQRIRNK